METPLVFNIELATLENTYFRRSVFSGQFQLVLMSIPVGQDIGIETHSVDQFIRVESGTGFAVLNGQRYNLTDGTGVVIPAGTEHNIINVGNNELKLYTIYSLPIHPAGLIE
jgi:mannose-6-phosphate isomerase-like protein (cupin superfamily)